MQWWAGWCLRNVEWLCYSEIQHIVSLSVSKLIGIECVFFWVGNILTNGQTHLQADLLKVTIGAMQITFDLFCSDFPEYMCHLPDWLKTASSNQSCIYIQNFDGTWYAKLCNLAPLFLKHGYWKEAQSRPSFPCSRYRHRTPAEFTVVSYGIARGAQDTRGEEKEGWVGVLRCFRDLPGLFVERQKGLLAQAHHSYQLRLSKGQFPWLAFSLSCSDDVLREESISAFPYQPHSVSIVPVSWLLSMILSSRAVVKGKWVSGTSTARAVRCDLWHFFH